MRREGCKTIIKRIGGDGPTRAAVTPCAVREG